LSNYLSPLGSITGVLQAAGGTVSGIVWGQSSATPPTPGSPWYKQASEPPPAFPYVVFTIKGTTGEHVMGDPAYEAEFTVSFAVYGTQGNIEAVSSPFASTGLYHFLDGLANNPAAFSGTLFDCVGWYSNLDWDVDLEDVRGTDGFTRVYVSKCSYTMKVNRTG
jgi:hypothetical protein